MFVVNFNPESWLERWPTKISMFGEHDFNCSNDPARPKEWVPKKVSAKVAEKFWIFKLEWISLPSCPGGSSDFSILSVNIYTPIGLCLNSTPKSKRPRFISTTEMFEDSNFFFK